MPALARVYDLREIEEDPSVVEGTTKECSGCDPDSPTSVPRISCKTCGGTGREKLAILEIMAELKQSELDGEPTYENDETGGAIDEDDDPSLYLEG